MAGIRSDQGEEFQDRFLSTLNSHICSAGPEGWLTWTLEYRNMLVHRGRHIQPSEMTPSGARLFAPDGQVIICTTPVPLLPREPGLSEMEAFKAAGKRRATLTEHASVTLSGALDSTLFLVERVGADLLEFWKIRKANPDLILQPPKQWPADLEEVESKFEGYSPGQVAVEPDTLVGPPTLPARLKAASLEGAGLERWKDFSTA